MTEYVDSDDYSGMTQEIEDAIQDSHKNCQEWVAETLARQAAGEMKSEKCDFCGKIETVPVGTQFKDVTWQNHEGRNACDDCATEHARREYKEKTSDVMLAQRYILGLVIGLLILGAILYFLVGGV